MRKGELKLLWKKTFVKENKSKGKENSRLFELIQVQLFSIILLIYYSAVSFIKTVVHFENSVTYWLVWLFVTWVNQLGFDSLKVLHLVITMFAQTTDIWLLYS